MDNILQGSDYVTALVIAIYAFTLSNYDEEVAVIVGIVTALWVLFQLIRGVIKFNWEYKDRKESKNKENNG